MRIIKHGSALKFNCNRCGCEFVACRGECMRKQAYVESLPTGYEYWYICPECGKNTQGFAIEAKDVNEYGDGPEEHKA